MSAAPATTGDHGHGHGPRQGLAALALGALGVVYGDIGTSPLYTMREVLNPANGVTLQATDIVGAVSAIFWALMLVVTLKYVVLILRADNKGEGGIMALTALAVRAAGSTAAKRRVLLLVGVCGASLFYGDSVITPAISVMGAVEGLEIVTPAFKPFVLPISIAVLTALFFIQRHGSAAVDEIKRELKLPEVKVQYVVVTGADRIPKLQKGEIDLECGSTTNTKARQEQVDFSYTVFVAGMRVLLANGTRVESIKDLDGLTIALSKGTTSEKLFTQLQHSGEAKMQLVQYPGNNEAFKALREGKAKAFAQDDALLLGLASKDKALDSLSLGQMAFSVEPYGIMMRKGDARLGAAVDRALSRIYGSGEIQQLYGKWFQTDALAIPMNRLTRDSFKRPNKEAGVAMLLGYSI